MLTKSEIALNMKIKIVDFSELQGKTLKSITITDDEKIDFTTTSNEQYRLYHEQECCEGVYVEDVIGDLKDLIGTPILLAEESSSEINHDTKDEHDCDHSTWTFYKLSTIKGNVTIRWCGKSNGYYSEAVDFVRLFLGN